MCVLWRGAGDSAIWLLVLVLGGAAYGLTPARKNVPGFRARSSPATPAIRRPHQDSSAPGQDFPQAIPYCGRP
jgi:hypothetical protein